MAAPRSATGTLLKSDLREDLREPVALDALGAAFLAFFAAGFLAAGFLATVFFLAGAAFLAFFAGAYGYKSCLLYTSPSPRDATLSRMPSSA